MPESLAICFFSQTSTIRSIRLDTVFGFRSSWPVLSCVCASLVSSFVASLFAGTNTPIVDAFFHNDECRALVAISEYRERERVMKAEDTLGSTQRKTK